MSLKCLRCGADSAWIEGNKRADDNETVADLTAQVATLTKERDEARAELEQHQAALVAELREAAEHSSRDQMTCSLTDLLTRAADALRGIGTANPPDSSPPPAPRGNL